VKVVLSRLWNITPRQRVCLRSGTDTFTKDFIAEVNCGPSTSLPAQDCDIWHYDDTVSGHTLPEQLTVDEASQHVTPADVLQHDLYMDDLISWAKSAKAVRKLHGELQKYWLCLDSNYVNRVLIHLNC
jgi:hypothetical protein